MRDFGQEVVRDYSILPFAQNLIVHLVLGLCAGLLFGSLEHIYEKYIFRNIGFGKAIFLGSLFYTFVIVAIIALALVIFSSLSKENLAREQYWNFLLSKQTVLLIGYFFMVGTFTNLFREIDQKFGKGNLWKMLRGEFYSPKEEEKIFMFLDLKSSTKIAEGLGHIEYSKMIQDCFKDMGIVEKFGGEIYQYVGDEAVITWDIKKGLKNNNCIYTIYGFKDQLNNRRKHYLDTYGLFPEFKAGLHMGKIVTAEVGVHKREIAYHGDTINTTARIQEKCTILGREFLISEEAKNSFEPSKFLKYHDEGDIRLKGKINEVRIFSLYQIAG